MRVHWPSEHSLEVFPAILQIAEGVMAKDVVVFPTTSPVSITVLRRKFTDLDAATIRRIGQTGGPLRPEGLCCVLSQRDEAVRR